MMIVVSSGATGAAEKDISSIVDQMRRYIGYGILAIVVVSLLLLLLDGLALSEWLTGSTGNTAILTFGQIWRSCILSLVEVDASLALKDKLFVTDFGDKMVAGSPSP
jgi:hypothetical protein